MAVGSHLLNVRRAPNHDPTPSGAVRLLDPLIPDDNSAGWEIRAGDEGHQLIDGNLLDAIIVVQHIVEGLNQLPEIVGRYICRHTYSNTRGSVQE